MQSGNGQGRRTDRLGVVKALLLVQFAGCFILGVIGLIASKTVAVSLLVGGLICLIPNAYFAWRAFRFRGARAAKQILHSFYQGEAVKFILTAVLFAVVFVRLKPLAPGALFGGYILVLVLGWMVPLLYPKFSSNH